MYFEKGITYHIYNQGNNRGKVFFLPQNYLFFLTKIRQYVLPYGDILCYCLMPNHFHLLLHVNHVELTVRNTTGDLLDTENVKNRSLNDSIGILLRSYTRAINLQENRTGALFREETKAKNGLIDELITVDNKHKNLFFSLDNDYMNISFDYIHQNPVKAGLVRHAKDWQYSSAPDYAGLRNGTLCNQGLARQWGLV